MGSALAIPIKRANLTEDHAITGLIAIRDPCLRAVQQVGPRVLAVLDEGGSGRCSTSVGAVAGLGQHEAADVDTASNRTQKRLLKIHTRKRELIAKWVEPHIDVTDSPSARACRTSPRARYKASCAPT